MANAHPHKASETVNLLPFRRRAPTIFPLLLLWSPISLISIILNLPSYFAMTCYSFIYLKVLIEHQPCSKHNERPWEYHSGLCILVREKNKTLVNRQINFKNDKWWEVSYCEGSQQGIEERSTGEERKRGVDLGDFHLGKHHEDIFPPHPLSLVCRTGVGPGNLHIKRSGPGLRYVALKLQSALLLAPQPGSLRHMSVFLC